MKKKISPLKIRFFHCGEYGDKTRRPHYHALIFGYGFPDKVLFKKQKSKELKMNNIKRAIFGEMIRVISQSDKRIKDME
jgi:hypothetical protein